MVVEEQGTIVTCNVYKRVEFQAIASHMLWLTQQLHNYEDEIKRQRESLKEFMLWQISITILISYIQTKYLTYITW